MYAIMAAVVFALLGVAIYYRRRRVEHIVVNDSGVNSFRINRTEQFDGFDRTEHFDGFNRTEHSDEGEPVYEIPKEPIYDMSSKAPLSDTHYDRATMETLTLYDKASPDTIETTM